MDGKIQYFTLSWGYPWGLGLTITKYILDVGPTYTPGISWGPWGEPRDTIVQNGGKKEDDSLEVEQISRRDWDAQLSNKEKHYCNVTWNLKFKKQNKKDHKN